MRVGGLILVAIHCTVCVSVLCVHVEVKIFTTLCLVYHTLHQYSSHLLHVHDVLYVYIVMYMNVHVYMYMFMYVHVYLLHDILYVHVHVYLCIHHVFLFPPYIALC